ncbi:MAG TPA: NAD(P)-dependent oxidoreductase [Burkholderiaceae bacterium]|jgi:phosphoglycerate dehydrogenase-like enzyme|nr:NAD(P)-dependent oxidoreductase [Burkholderiaceae bacterium]
MARPRVEIYQAFEGFESNRDRLESAGASVVMPAEPWMQAANRRERRELELDPSTVVAAGIANLSDRITARTFDSAPELRMVAKFTVGYDNVDVDAATERGILVVHSPVEANWSGVAEGVMAMSLALLKKLRERDRQVKSGQWRDPALMGRHVGARVSDGFPGLTFGIVGLGRIGARVADLLRPWGVPILACDPYADESRFGLHHATPATLEQVLRESDVLTLHCNLTPETRGLIGEAQLALMKPTAILINSARGPIVDIDALHRALSQGKLAAAALDVLPVEPVDPQHPILGLGDKVLLSPHMIAGNVNSGLYSAAGASVERAIFAALRGEVPRNVVNPRALPKWLERFEGRRLI